MTGIAKHIAAAPNCFDIMLTASRRLQLLAEFTNEDIDDFEFRLVHATIKVIEEHFLGQRRAFTQRQQFEHLILFACQVNAGAAYLEEHA